MHAHLAFDGTVLIASDTMIGEDYAGMKNVWLSLTYAGVEDAQRIFSILAGDGKVVMPFSETFWSRRPVRSLTSQDRCGGTRLRIAADRCCSFHYGATRRRSARR